MKRPIESEYNSHVAYTRALEAYCDSLTLPAQEPVARVSGTYGGRFVYDPINRAAILPVGMALYTTPPKRPWVGLTPEETSGFTQHEMTVVKYVSKVLQEKNT
jgi:hypothetical protein